MNADLKECNAAVSRGLDEARELTHEAVKEAERKFELNCRRIDVFSDTIERLQFVSARILSSYLLLRHLRPRKQGNQ